MSEIFMMLVTFALVLKSTATLFKQVKAADGEVGVLDRAMGIAWTLFTLLAVGIFVETVHFSVPVWGWCLLVVGVVGNIQVSAQTYFGFRVQQ